MRVGYEDVEGEAEEGNTALNATRQGGIQLQLAKSVLKHAQETRPFK